MRILDWTRLDEQHRREALARPSATTHGEIDGQVRAIIEDVRQRGDAAVREYTRRYDGVALDSLTVTAAEFAEARRHVDASLRTALERMIACVERFHEAQRPRSIQIETAPGVRCELVYRPIPSVGLYVPAGTAPLPSSAIMLAVPARLAGCPRRVLCTPPGPDGRVHPAILMTAELCGVEEVYKAGGAQAIAALAYGTESLAPVDKIFGPGNVWVTRAKQVVTTDPRGPACDLPAGPSEVLVVADEEARPEWVAADLLAQAEHDPDAQALLVTTSAGLAHAVRECLEKQAARLTRQAILQRSLAACRAFLVSDLDMALALVNAYAPEHLILNVREPRSLLAGIVNAGAVFLGAWSTESVGDYGAGPNHVLPTGGRARSHGGLGVMDYLRGMSVQELTPEGLNALGAPVVTLARLEGLEAHAAAVLHRLGAAGGVPAQRTSRSDHVS